jgi:hypothetical protein
VELRQRLLAKMSLSELTRMRESLSSSIDVALDQFGITQENIEMAKEILEASTRRLPPEERDRWKRDIESLERKLQEQASEEPG